MEVTTGSWRCILGESPRACTNSRFPPAQLTKQTNKLACWHAFWKCQFLSGHWCAACSIICFVFKKKKKMGTHLFHTCMWCFHAAEVHPSPISEPPCLGLLLHDDLNSFLHRVEKVGALHWSCGGIQICSTPLGLSKNMTNVNPTSSVS